MQQHVGMSRNIQTVNTYLDGFRRNDHEQILSCLTEDIEWTVFGAFHLTGKKAYDTSPSSTMRTTSNSGGSMNSGAPSIAFRRSGRILARGRQTRGREAEARTVAP
jgi:hypothetical protein